MGRSVSGLVLLALLLIAGWLFWSHTGHPRGLDRLHGRLKCVEIQFDSWGVVTPPTSPWQGKWVGSDDPDFLARVETWLQTVKRPTCDHALRQRGGRILLTFQDGRQEDILFLGPDRPGPSAGSCGGFAWDGLGLVGGREPFTSFLRDLTVEGKGWIDVRKRVWEGPSTSGPGAWKAHGPADVNIVARHAEARWAGFFQVACCATILTSLAGLKQPSPRSTHDQTLGRRFIVPLQSSQARPGPPRP